ncbi:cell wall protein [Streptomyces sp. NPDC048473]|uniref:cell wall protein n=1 Tax=unclassified Streptomyces TaxID=2593676 RepID=UPI0037241E84
MSTVAASAAVVIPSPRSEAGTVSELGFSLVLGAGQDVLHTRSRRAEPRAWLRSVVWLVSAGLHPRSGPATVAVAKDLAGRMDYRRGVTLYDLDGTVRRTGLSRATVKRHVAILRELGALVWLVHGSRHNLRLPGEGGYTATATVYGAVIPRVFDTAMGHRLAGGGYEARVCGVTEVGRERAIAEAAKSTAKPVDNRAVDNSCSQGREPHSLGLYHRSPQADVESGSKDTSRRRASRSTTSARPAKSSSNSGGARRTARQVQRSIWITRQVRARVNWTQSERLRRLEFVLRPLTDAGLDADAIAAELHSWMLTWRPARPAEFIRARLAKQATDEHVATEFEAAEGWDQTDASGSFSASSPSLVRCVLAGLAAGMAAYSATQAELGLDDLTGADAAADMAVFLGTGVLA